MNIAFIAFMILFLLLPGFLFVNTYTKKENTNLEKKSLDASSAKAVLASLILHSIAISLNNLIFGKMVNYEVILKILLNNNLTPEQLKLITSNISYIVFYNIFVYSLSYILAKILQWIQFKCNPHKKSLLAFSLPWYYELNGMVEKGSKIPDLIKITCMVDTKEHTYLYSGILVDFYYTPDGSLDRIILSNVQRSFLIDNIISKSTDFLSCDTFIIKYSEIKKYNNKENCR